MGTQFVTLGIGTKEDILGVGVYQLRLRSGRTLLLHDVLFVPESDGGLASGPLVGNGVNCLWALTATQFNHLNSLEKRVNKLKEEIKALRDREYDVKEKLNTGKVKLAKDPTKEVQSWLGKVENITREVTLIQFEFVGNRRILNWYLPKYYLCIDLSKRAEGKTIEVTKLCNDVNHWKDIFADRKPAAGMKIPVTTLVGKTTAEKTYNRVWNSLMKAEIGIIGVYGMGGAGKTTIMRHINNELLKEKNLFHIIIWVTVSKVLNIEKLQDGIANQLDLNVSNYKDEVTRAAKLSESLEQRKFVLILDDVWEEFSLEMIGIPTPSKENGSKLILTTRFLDICVRTNCQESIKVESLLKEEAWELFKQNVGNNVKLTPEVEEIAQLVTRECACLPLAIVTVGQAMKEKADIRDWRNALRELKSLISKSMKNKVFARLKFSYERLSDVMVQECFLYCALYPEDHKISTKELIYHWVAEGLIDDLKDTEAERDKGYVVLQELKNSCMLESLDGGEFVKMHDLIRDMAIHITSESNRFIVKAGVELEESLEVKEWTDTIERISLMNNRIKILSDGPKCMKLSTLLLQYNPLTQGIPDSFFKQMHNLRVLNLSYTEIEYLPDSISDLEKLRALLLEHCEKLKKVPKLSRLTKLRVLNLSETKIEALPEGMEEAVNLRHVDLNNTKCLRLFPAGVLPKLHLLEDLLMKDCGWEWPVGTLKANGGAGIDDIISLSQLASLKIQFEGLEGWTSYFGSGKWESLKSFLFSIGMRGYKEIVDSSKWNFSVKIGGCNLASEESSLIFPDNTQFFHIKDCIIRLSQLSNLKDLKELYMEGLEGIEECLDTKKDNILSSLEKLRLVRLPSLRTVCKGAMPSGTLASLKLLFAYGCPKMMNALPLGLFQNLLNLEMIRVTNCELIEEIAGEEKEEETSSSTISLPNLKCLKLKNLPKLKRICKSILVCKLLDKITVVNCPLLKKLPFSVDNIPPSLKKIEGRKDWWDALEWDDPNIKIHLQPNFKKILGKDEVIVTRKTSKRSKSRLVAGYGEKKWITHL